MTEVVDLALQEWLPAEGFEPSKIHKAMRYSVFAGGKRLRPILSIAAAECLGGQAARALPAGCALELIHTYSLIHDDLPAMDNDDFRRGKPTSHKIFGEGNAILAGDALLTYAFELLVGESEKAGIAPQTITTLVMEVARAAGSLGMVGGQIMDLAAEGCKISLDELEDIHRRKTGAILRAAVRVGAIATGANNEQLNKLTQYAEALGLAFQIKDDILDVEGDSTKLGKQVGSDVNNAKSTYPALLGMEKSKLLLVDQISIAIDIAEGFGARGRILAELARFVGSRES